MAVRAPIQVTDRSQMMSEDQEHSFHDQQPTQAAFTDFPEAGGPFLEYRKLVGDISENLRKDQALRLAYMYKLPAWYYEVGPTYDSSHSLRILIALEGKGVFSPKNMHGLATALNSIQRIDLEKLVTEFIGMDVGHHGRLNTHPQKNLRQTWSNYSLRNVPRPLLYQHSTSLTSIAADALFGDVEKDGVPRTHSKPELDAVKNTQDSPVLRKQQQQSSAYKGEMQIGLNFALMNSRTLLKQLMHLQAATAGDQKSTSSPCHGVHLNVSVQSSLEGAISAAQQLVSHLKSACAGKELSGSELHPSARSTPTRDSETSPTFPPTKSTRKFSRASSNGQVVTPSGLSCHSSGVFMSPIRLQDSDTKPLLDSDQDPTEADGKQTCKTSLPEKIADGILPPLREEMHRTIPGMTTRKLSRQRSKKLCRKGLLVWQLKVKRLRDYTKQREFKLESEDFFDNLKRRFRASLFPHGLGEDTGEYMTLWINCLDEPKTHSISNTVIVVSILDPQSSTHTIQPITRTMERRGIRVVQQFISHKQVSEFQSTIVLLSIAAVGKQEESDDTGDSA